MNVSPGWLIAGAVVVGGIILYLYVDKQNAISAQQPLQGLGSGIDSSRAEVVEGLKLGQSIAGLGTSIANAFIAGQPKAGADANQSAGSGGTLRSSSVVTPPKAPVKK